VWKLVDVIVIYFIYYLFLKFIEMFIYSTSYFVRKDILNYLFRFETYCCVQLKYSN